MHLANKLLLLASISLFLASCQNEEPLPPAQAGEELYDINLPAWFPDVPRPEGDAYVITKKRFELGRKLFYDPILSRNNTKSCGSCHLASLALSDSVRFSVGLYGDTMMRNSPPLFNLAYATSMFKDGGSTTLEHQVLGPLDNVKEFDLIMPELLERIKVHPEYPQLIKDAYGREVDAFSITRAIAAFERAMISGNSPFDRYYYQGDQNAISASAKRGWTLFNDSKTQCVTCHSGFNFTNFTFENTGTHITYQDSGRAGITLNSSDHGKFKVPSLRNVEVTGPYMFDGQFKTLDEVLDHYAAGGKGHWNQSGLITGFSMTPQEKSDLKAFLLSLTDTEFLNNPDFQEP